LAFYEGGLAREAVDFSDLIPKAGVAIKASREAREGIALADHIATPI
jgi:hypothetical protein